VRSAMIVYDGLPISAGGAHTLRSTNLPGYLERFESFFSARIEPLTPITHGIALTHPVELDGWYSDVYSRLVRGHGDPTTSVLTTDLRVSGWGLAPAEAPEALKLIAGVGPDPRPQGITALVLRFGCSFRLLDPDRSGVLPFQDPDCYRVPQGPFGRPAGVSDMAVSLGAKSTCRLHLCLPFEEVDQKARDVAADVSAGLPFSLSRKHWALWRVNRAGTGYFPRKVEIP
jgi:hypothetical protein